MLQVTNFLQTRLKKSRFRRNDRTSRSPARRFSAADQSLTFLFHKKSAPLGPWNTNFCQVDKSRQLNAFRPPRKSESCVFLWRKSAVDGQAAAAAPILMISTCSMGLNFGPSVPVRLFQSRSFRFLKIYFFFRLKNSKSGQTGGTPFTRVLEHIHGTVWSRWTNYSAAEHLQMMSQWEVHPLHGQLEQLERTK